jgi:hypothetical protein
MSARAVTLAVMSLWICTTPASTQEQTIQGVWVGTGAISCARYAQEVRSMGKPQRIFYFTWAQGYMSGVNSVVLYSAKHTNLGLRDVEAQLAFLDRYCDQHPEAFYVQAVLNLYDAMRSEQDLPDWRPAPKH